MFTATLQTYSDEESRIVKQALITLHKYGFFARDIEAEQKRIISRMGDTDEELLKQIKSHRDRVQLCMELDELGRHFYEERADV